MTRPPHLIGLKDDAEAVADTLLDQSSELVGRSGARRAHTWHRVRRSALGLSMPAAPPRRRVTGWLPLTVSGLALGVALIPLVRTGTAELRSGRVPAADSSAIAAPPKVPPQLAEPEGWREIELEGIAHLFAAPGAIFLLPEPVPAQGSDYVINLERGELCAQVVHRDPDTQGHFVIRAPDLRATAIGTRFCVFAGQIPEGSWVGVEEGRVRVDRVGLHPLIAGVGDVLRSDEPAGTAVVSLRPPGRSRPPGVARAMRTPGGASSCLSSSSSEKRQECLWLQAGGNDLAAQNALYLLGAQAQSDEHDGPTALSIWQTDLHRFPHGALAEETTWAVFDELVSERRYPEALSTAEGFLRMSPDSTQTAELTLKRGDLLAGPLARPLEAEQAYREVLASQARPYLREQALYELGLCHERVGAMAEARATWQHYRSEFPQGRHAADVLRRLEPLAGPSPR